MKISLLTDAPKHNLALMKLSAWHRANGDEVLLNMPIIPADYTYASILYEWNKKRFIANEYGGAAYVSKISHNQVGVPTDEFFNGRGKRQAENANGQGAEIIRQTLPTEVENILPDYGLYDLTFSLGYTFRPCFNSCDFCNVPIMDHPDINHHSIWEFHNPNFKKICLLNNNTFQDPLWRETFSEIWDAELTVIDENGYDLRLIDDEKAQALKRTKFQGRIHFAWDRMADEALIVEGLKTLRHNKISGTTLYVLIGYNTTIDEDIHRCEIIRKYKQTPYIMPFKRTKENKRFKRFMDTFMWRKYKTIEAAWSDYTA